MTHTVQTAAAELGATPGQVRDWCRKHAIGTMLTPRMRVLSADDIEALRKLSQTIRLGNPGTVRDESGRFSRKSKPRRR